MCVCARNSHDECTCRSLWKGICSCNEHTSVLWWLFGLVGWIFILFAERTVLLFSVLFLFFSSISRSHPAHRLSRVRVNTPKSPTSLSPTEDKPLRNRPFDDELSSHISNDHWWGEWSHRAHQLSVNICVVFHFIFVFFLSFYRLVRNEKWRKATEHILFISFSGFAFDQQTTFVTIHTEYSLPTKAFNSKWAPTRAFK